MKFFNKVEEIHGIKLVTKTSSLLNNIEGLFNVPKRHEGLETRLTIVITPLNFKYIP